jgi:catechol-2,3-dioxygenase
MPKIERLGHVGIYVRDVNVMLRFYSEVLGLQITDIDEKAGLYFLSSRPDEEHHELLLCAGRKASEDGLLLQQMSFKCPSLDDVIEFHRRLVETGAKIDYTVTHGNAIAVYFSDPEGNRAEVYWNTGLKARQGYLLEIDLNDEPAAIKQKVADHVATYGDTGFVDYELLSKQQIS